MVFGNLFKGRKKKNTSSSNSTKTTTTSSVTTTIGEEEEIDSEDSSPLVYIDIEPLSSDELLEIFLYLPLNSLYRVLQLSKRIHHMVDSETQWKRVYELIVIGGEKLDDSMTWKENCLVSYRNTWTMESNAGKTNPFEAEITNMGRAIRMSSPSSSTNYPIAFLKRQIPWKGVMRVDFTMSATVPDHLNSNYIIFGVVEKNHILNLVGTSTYVGYSSSDVNIGYANNGYVSRNGVYNVHSDLSFRQDAKISILINANKNRLEAKGSDWTRPYGELWFLKDDTIVDDRFHIVDVFKNNKDTLHIAIQLSNANYERLTVQVTKISYGEHLLSVTKK